VDLNPVQDLCYSNVRPIQPQITITHNVLVKTDSLWLEKYANQTVTKALPVKPGAVKIVLWVNTKMSPEVHSVILALILTPSLQWAPSVKMLVRHVEKIKCQKRIRLDVIVLVRTPMLQEYVRQIVPLARPVQPGAVKIVQVANIKLLLEVHNAILVV